MMFKKEDALERFIEHGNRCMFHYADDSGKEWDQGDREKLAALKIWNEHPHLHEDMKDIAQEYQFFWFLNSLE